MAHPGELLNEHDAVEHTSVDELKRQIMQNKKSKNKKDKDKDK